MNHDYDEEFDRGAERRSRRNPKMRDGASAGSQAGSPGSGRVPGSGSDEREKWENRTRQVRQERQNMEDSLNVMGDPSSYAGAGRSGGAISNGGSGSPARPSRPVQPRAVGSRPAPSASNGGSGRGGAGGGAGGRGGQLSGGSGGLPPRMGAEIARKKKRRRMITMIIAECFALVFIFGFAFVARTGAKLQRDDVVQPENIAVNDINVESVETMKGYWTIAVFGVDSRDNAISKGTNADVNLICNINRDTGEIKLVSVYRDTYLNVSSNGSYNKLNYAYAVGGPEQAMETLNRNLDIKVQDYVTFNWKAVANAIDILGGVDIELSKAEFYYINSFITETVKATGIGSHQLKHAGMNHLDGVQAVAYGRLRLMDTDFARTERQRKVIAQAFEKAKKADFKTLYTLIGTIFPQVKTSIWVDDMVSNAKNINKFYLGETTGFPQARGDANMNKQGLVVVPATLESNVIKLHEFLFGDENYTPSATVKSISGKIAAKTGIVKEGQFIDKVGTDSGVIQPPKTKPAEKETKDSGDDAYQYVYETDEDGEKVRKKIKKETDEDGEYMEWETDEDGFLKETKSQIRPSDTETDGGGNPVTSGRPGGSETNSFRDEINGNTGGRPGGTGTDNPAGPTASDNPSTSDRPGATAGSTDGIRPGDGQGSYPGGTGTTPGTPDTAPTAPGQSVSPTAPGSGTTTSPTAPSATLPQGSTGEPGTSQTQQVPGGGGATAPTAPTSGGAVQQGPGGAGPADQGSSGPVAGPGQ